MSIEWQDYRQWLREQLALDPLPDVPPPHPNAISFDSRNLASGQWFFALPGENYDGHNYITASLEEGASGFFAAIPYKNKLPAAAARRGVWITDAQKALNALAQGYRQSLDNTKVIAITGSTAKTTLKELVASILKQSNTVTKSPASYNNEIGVPKTILSIKPNDQVAVLEFGARHIGDLSALAMIAAPDIAVCTNIGTAHLGIFGSRKNLITAKTEIYRDSPAHCVCIVNKDYQDLVAEAENTKKKIITFGYHEDADVRIAHTSSTGKQSVKLVTSKHIAQQTFTLSTSNQHFSFPINVAAAAAICLELGISTEDMQAGIDSNQNAPARFQKIKSNGLTVIDDSYNANPESMRCGLKSLLLSYPKHRKVLILGDMLELGKDSVSYHRELGQEVMAVNPALVITVGSLARHITADLNGITTMSFATVEEIQKQKIDFKKYGELVYLKASNKVNLTKIATALI